jgi:hypothetical protein
MSCSKCNEYIDPCNNCDPCDNSKDTTCNCPVKDLSTDCVVYTGDTLECSGIPQNTILTTVLQDLDAHICNKFDEAIQYLTLINIGGGSEVYRGITGIGNKEIRTIVSEDTTHLDVVENSETIGIRGGVHRLELDSGTDILSLIVNALSGDTTLSTIDLSEFNYDTFVQSGVYAAAVITLTLTDASTVDIDLSTLITEIAAAQVNADYLESNPASKAHVLNKNPSKTVVLGPPGTYNLLPIDNNYIIEIDNGVNDVTIDVTGIVATTEFFTGFIQKGTGLVTIVGAGSIPELLTNVIFGQGHACALEAINSTKYLIGNLKFA